MIGTTFLNDGGAIQPNSAPAASIVNDGGVPASERYTEDIKTDLGRLLIGDGRLLQGPTVSGATPCGAPWVQDVQVPSAGIGGQWFAIIGGSDGKTYKVPFTLGQDGEPVVGDGEFQEVTRDSTWVPVDKEGREQH